MSKKKIAVCLPTFNEAQNIVKITKKVDKSLVRLAKNYDCVIANADNNSPDHTNEIFRNTKTYTYKVSLVSKATGKGENICNFLAYCKKNHIDYAFTIDADLKFIYMKEYMLL